MEDSDLLTYVLPVRPTDEGCVHSRFYLHCGRGRSPIGLHPSEGQVGVGDACKPHADLPPDHQVLPFEATWGKVARSAANPGERRAIPMTTGRPMRLGKAGVTRRPARCKSSEFVAV